MWRAETRNDAEIIMTVSAKSMRTFFSVWSHTTVLRKHFTYFIVTLMLLPCNRTYYGGRLTITMNWHYICAFRQMRVTLTDAHINALTGTIYAFYVILVVLVG